MAESKGRPKGTGKCEICGTIISRYAKRCRDHRDQSKNLEYRQSKVPIPEKFLVRGKINTRSSA